MSKKGIEELEKIILDGMKKCEEDYNLLTAEVSGILAVLLIQNVTKSLLTYNMHFRDVIKEIVRDVIEDMSIPETGVAPVGAMIIDDDDDGPGMTQMEKKTD